MGVRVPPFAPLTYCKLHKSPELHCALSNIVPTIARFHDCTFDLRSRPERRFSLIKLRPIEPTVKELLEGLQPTLLDFALPTLAEGLTLMLSPGRTAYEPKPWRHIPAFRCPFQHASCRTGQARAPYRNQHLPA